MRPQACSPFQPGSLTDATSAPALYDQYPSYQQVLDWISGFVTQPHPALGRPGAVCPRLAPALHRNRVHLITASTPQDATVDTVTAIGTTLASLYADLFTEPETFRSGALLAVFSSLPPERAAECIDGAHARLRMNFVGQGLMIGEFHPASTVASVHNAALPVMRCPVPMLAVRALTRHDQVFLDQDGTAPSVRAQYLTHLLNHVGDQLPDTERERIRVRIAALKEDLT